MLGKATFPVIDTRQSWPDKPFRSAPAPCLVYRYEFGNLLEAKRMKGPKTYDEYVDLVHNAVYEVDEMRAGLDYDPENAERWAAILDHLDGVLRKLYDDMISDRYQFPTGKDLPYMQFLNRWGREVPFKQLLVVINQAHKDGLSRE